MAYLNAVTNDYIHALDKVTYNNKHFKLFLKELFSREEGEYDMILDNAKIHVSKKTKEFYVEKKFCSLFLLTLHQ
ncbi:unnamed protein product [Moneuplotes crassus]|uniref:Uncharacterized protein n=1 Tax=Euplotes crassus TaxID=5936 RepID=A0AAD1U8N3_EUPCR|nr:unnamed protein product [Moneuplotes crassus]